MSFRGAWVVYGGSMRRLYVEPSTTRLHRSVSKLNQMTIMAYCTFPGKLAFIMHRISIRWQSTIPSRGLVSTWRNWNDWNWKLHCRQPLKKYAVSQSKFLDNKVMWPEGAVRIMLKGYGWRHQGMGRRKEICGGLGVMYLNRKNLSECRCLQKLRIVPFLALINGQKAVSATITAYWNDKVGNAIISTHHRRTLF